LRQFVGLLKLSIAEILCSVC